MNKDNIIKLTLISFITMLVLTILGVTYAYFTLDIEGTPKDIVMTSGDLRLEYKDETELKLDGAFPGDTITKVITVTNIGTMNASYSLYLGNLINTIEKNELSISLDCKSYTNYNETTKTESGTCNGGKKVIPVSNTISTMTIKDGISIEPNITQEYTVTITFKETKKEQNYNKNKNFSGQIGIGESTLPEPVYCTFDGELVQGAEYVNGQYTYRYMQEGKYVSSGIDWSNIASDGWGVQLTDKTSTDPVTSRVCTYINNKPVVSMSYIFSDSQATTIDVSNFDTSNVTDMYAMFYKSQATTLDVSSFDTSNVTNMGTMFNSSKATTLDVSNFDTSKVTDMSGTFWNSQATTLDLSSFDTSNVTDMSSMFYGSQAATLDVSSFDTSKVTDMYYMFYNSKAITLDVSNFDTSKVTNMESMFSESKAITLDVSNFNTSNVTNMESMFSNCKNLKTIYASDKFVTTNVTSDISMFYLSSNLVGGSGTVFDSTKIDKTYARIDRGTELPGYFTLKS